MLKNELQKIAWAAGLFEGEGTIVISKEKTKAKAGNIDLALSSVDKDVIDRFYSYMGCGAVYGPYQYGTNRQPFYRWMAYNSQAILVLKLFIPWFCTRRSKRAKEAIIAHQKRLTRPHYRASRKGIGGKPTHKKR